MARRKPASRGNDARSCRQVLIRRSLFGRKIAPDSIDGRRRPARVQVWGFVMGIEYPPHRKQDHLGVLLRGAAGDVVPLRGENASPHAVELPDRDEEFLDILSAALQEAPKPQRDESRLGEDDDARLLVKKNAWLRKLAIRLSNLLGDLPGRE
jgi:hypothetical protein